MAVKPSPMDTTLAEHSRRIRMLEEVFMPMAKAAMEILMGKPGEPGMAEDLRNVRSQLKSLLDAHAEDVKETLKVRKEGFERIEKLEGWKEKIETNKQADKEVKLLGIKTTSEMKISIIGGLFLIVNTVVTYLATR